jgi:DNA-binding beta-propeller fold protein YncE
VRHTRIKNFLFMTILISAAIFVSAFQMSQQKLRVTTNNASVYAAPEIGADVLAKVSVDTILESNEKQGEWYSVTMDSGGIKIQGFIHEMLVEVYQGSGEIGAFDNLETRANQPEESRIEATIMLLLDESKSLIREKTGFEKVLTDLSPLIAKVFRITDLRKQRQLAVEIYLWRGLAFAGKDDLFNALKEFRNMFEVDNAYAKEMTRNLYDPQIMSIISQAEKEYLGIITEYSLEITTDPKEASLTINGRDVGLSPEVYSSKSPEIALKIEKEGYETVEETFFMIEPNLQKNYVLKAMGYPLNLRSVPAGAKVFLDDQDTGQMTNCTLPMVMFGNHSIRFEKENYAPHKVELTLNVGDGAKMFNAVMTVSKYDVFGRIGNLGSKFFKDLSDVCLDRENNLFVLDSSSRKIRKFTPEGRIVPSWGLKKKELNDIKEPGGIAVDSKGYIYVTDAKKQTLHKFNKDGTLIYKIGSQGNGKDEFQYPDAIAVDFKDFIYVLDRGNSRVKKISSDGKVVKMWGNRGRGNGQFMLPSDIACSASNEIFVLDQNRIQRFNSEGEYLGSWGKAGNAEDEFLNPKSLDIDGNNIVYITDSGNHRIQKYDAQGKFLASWGEKGVENNQMNDPCGIVVAPTGRVYIVEKGNERIQVFDVPPDK